jgi:hypothetical protein
VRNYLTTTAGLSVKLGGLGNIRLFGYSDASYVTDGNCKSRLGGCIFLGYDSGAIHSFSKNDTILSSLSHSSTEAEIKAVDEIVREMMHIKDMLDFILGEPYDRPIKIFCDNNSAIKLFESLRTNNKVKHINMRINFIREMIFAGFITIHFVPTEHNVADIMTKPLPIDQFKRLRHILMQGHGGVEPVFEELHVALTATSLLIIKEEL